MRFQELESDEDGNHGVPVSVYKQQNRNRSVSDELFFNDGASRFPRREYSDEHLAYGERYESPVEDGDSDDDAGGRRPANSLVRRDSDQIIAQRALDKVARAKAKGKGSVNLTHEELEALEKRRSRRRSSDSPDSERQRRGSGGKHRSPSGSNSGAWTRKRGSRRSSVIASTSTALAPISKTKPASAKERKKLEDSYAAAGQQPPPAFMTMGPGGVPVYAPLGYGYPQLPPPGRRTASDSNRYSPPRSGDSSRSTSASSRRGQQQQPLYDQHQPPYPSSRNATRPPSLHSEGGEYWAPPPYAYAPYAHPHDPSQGGRRVASGPPNVAYSSVYRRVPVPRMQPSHSDPNMHAYAAGPSGLGNEYEPSSATSEDEESDEDELLGDPAFQETPVVRPSSVGRRGPAAPPPTQARPRRRR